MNAVNETHISSDEEVGYFHTKPINSEFYLEHDESDTDESDAELQEALKQGNLKPGLNIELPQKVSIYNKVAMRNKLAAFKQDLNWIERLDCSSCPVPVQNVNEEDESLLNDDFKREMLITRQAQATVLEGLKKLKELNIAIKRPPDYFAEMAKSDEHMKKVKEKLIKLHADAEKREKSQKLRRLKKFGKKVQQEATKMKLLEKASLENAVKRFRSGDKKALNFISDSNRTDKMPVKKKKNKKREAKNKKYGFGGKRRNRKSNTAESTLGIKVKNSKPVERKYKKRKTSRKKR